MDVGSFWNFKASVAHQMAKLELGNTVTGEVSSRDASRRQDFVDLFALMNEAAGDTANFSETLPPVKPLLPKGCSR